MKKRILIILCLIVYLFPLFVMQVNGADYYQDTLQMLKQQLPEQSGAFIQEEYLTAVYYPKNKKISLIILAKPFFDLKKRAEERLVSYFNVDAQIICIFNIEIYTLASVDPSYIGKIYKPSFCDVPAVLAKNSAVNDVVSSTLPTTTQSGPMATISRPKLFKSSDLNADGAVNALDYAILIQHYAEEGDNLSFDLNSDRRVNSLDLSILVEKL